MKQLRYIIFLLLIFLGLFSGDSKAEVVTIKNEKAESFSEYTFHEPHNKSEWLGLLYLQEETLQNQNSFFYPSLEVSFSKDSQEELCQKSTGESFELDYQFPETLSGNLRRQVDVNRLFTGNPALVDSWKKLDDLGVDDALRKNLEILSKVDDLYDPSKFQLPGNRPVVNGKKLDGDFTVKTRDGKHDIYFDKNGFPDFEDFSLGKDFSFKPDGKVLDGSSSDFSKATDWLKNKYADNPNVKVKNNGSNIDVTVNGQKNTYTWHHHQDGKKHLCPY